MTTPSREERNRVTLVGNGLRTVDGWLILAMYLEGKLTLKQTVAVNSRRVRLITHNAEHTRQEPLA